ncbi:hypothetical protein C8J56DRAFT_1058689 [Mycena floridula]|nr:hypothetical protein C8J56DRAFT_1058689 [Mycena floridula]
MRPPNLPVFMLEGTLRRESDLPALMAHIVIATEHEAVENEDLLPPDYVLALEPTPGKEVEFWKEISSSVGSTRLDYSMTSLPRVVVNFPHRPTLFVNEKVKVVFSYRALDARFNIYTTVPDYIALLDVNDPDAPQVLMYRVQRSGYLLLAAVELYSVAQRVLSALERQRQLSGCLTDGEGAERLWSYWSQDWFQRQGQAFVGTSETTFWQEDYDRRIQDRELCDRRILDRLWWAVVMVSTCWRASLMLSATTAQRHQPRYTGCTLQGSLEDTLELEGEDPTFQMRFRPYDERESSRWLHILSDTLRGFTNLNELHDLPDVFLQFVNNPQEIFEYGVVTVTFFKCGFSPEDNELYIFPRFIDIFDETREKWRVEPEGFRLMHSEGRHPRPIAGYDVRRRLMNVFILLIDFTEGLFRLRRCWAHSDLKVESSEVRRMSAASLSAAILVPCGHQGRSDKYFPSMNVRLSLSGLLQESAIEGQMRLTYLPGRRDIFLVAINQLLRLAAPLVEAPKVILRFPGDPERVAYQVSSLDRRHAKIEFTSWTYEDGRLCLVPLTMVIIEEIRRFYEVGRVEGVKLTQTVTMSY